MQVCTKIVETERGLATTYKGNYTQFVREKAERAAQQWSAFEKWSKEVQKQKEIIRRCVFLQTPFPVLEASYPSLVVTLA
jgi:ATPase subunit of ABC transporter with duplicated ATPase domains